MARIGIDARLVYYRQGGISQYTQHLIDEMAALDTHNDYVILHSRKDARNLAAGPNQRRAVCLTPAHHRLERLALAVELAPQRLDVLHSPDFIPPLNGRFKSVITIHDLAFLMYPDILTEESRRYYAGQIHAAARRADAILAVSQATCADAIDLLGAPPEKITVTPEAADRRYTPQPEAAVTRARQTYHLPEGYLLFVGTFEPRKNLGGLLRAYAELRADLRDAPALVIAGKRGWLYERLFTLAGELRLSQHVTWLEDPADADLPALYSGASLVCLPSFYEGFGLTALEAMACATPVVVSNRGSLPEVVGDAALMVNPDDPTSIAEGLRRVLEDAALAADLRARGPQRAAQFSWRETARLTLGVYRRLAAQ